jgi:hypothetical protein
VSVSVSTGATERNDSVRLSGCQAAGAALEHRLPIDEGLRIRTLEAVDRLLVVADREHGARPQPCTDPGEELLRQRPDHRPLVRVGVLRLVEQHVINALVELVVHPLHGPVGLQQAARGGDQVVVVEGRASLLGLAVALDHRQADAGESGRGFGEPHRAQPGLDRDHTLGLGQGDRESVGAERLHLLRRDRLLGAWRAAPGQEQQPVVIPTCCARVRVRGEPSAQRVPVLHLPPVRADPRLGEPRERIRDRCRRAAGLRQDRVFRIVEIESKGAPLRCRHAVRAVADRGESRPPARGQHGGDRFAEPAGIGQRREPRHRLLARRGQRRLGERGLACLFEQPLRLGFLNQRELRHDARLQREAAQQALAEGVDGGNLHPAWQVKHAREQRARARARGRVGVRAREVGDLGIERLVRQRRPGAEPRLKPCRHLGRGRAGEGQAEDVRGIVPRQHQAQHTIDQEARLARPGRGRDPGGRARIGRTPLLRRGRAHSAPSPADHSSTRASTA